MIKPELLSPSGDFECLNSAVKFGADAVYLAGKEFGMRTASANFDNDELKKACEFAHKNNVKVHLTCNTLPRDYEVDRLPAFLEFAEDAGVDAFIIADVGVMALVRELLPDMEGERESFIRMANIFTSGEGHYRAQLSAMFKLILLKVIETADEKALPARMVEELDSYIRDNISDEISNTEIGAIFGYHPFYVSRMLKERKGMTMRQYIISYRLKLAKRLLELTDRSAAEIAEECGFTDASYFAKTFKSAFGMTPKEYRNGFKEDFM